MNNWTGILGSRAVLEKPTITTIGKSILIKGELSGDEELVIEGRVAGNINFHQNVVTVGEQGKVQASIAARTVVVAGEVRGDIVATKKVDIRDTGSVEGDITVPKVVIALGVEFRGSIHSKRSPMVKPAAPTSAKGTR